VLVDSERDSTASHRYELQLIAALLLFPACCPEAQPADFDLFIFPISGPLRITNSVTLCTSLLSGGHQKNSADDFAGRRYPTNVYKYRYKPKASSKKSWENREN
jgi:hypothetical protein